VRYFSVAGRTGGVGIWHPLWLPKMVLDGVEERTRQRLKDEWERERGMYVDRSIGCREDVKDDQEKPLWLREDEWGNDGLVTVQSARWGEFLGTMEGCDHWTMRGARGMELGVDLKAIGGGGGNNGGDGWAKLVGAWKRVERNAEVAAAHNSGDRTGRMPVRDREQERADEALIKSSTDKLSAVFDWLVEQVPVSRRGNGGKSFRDAVLEKEREATEAKRKDLDTKMDLERFYVALSRKLYDEGL
jgi:triacylglycerol lipase